MLTIKTNNADNKSLINISSEDTSSDNDMIYNKLLQLAGTISINPIFDTELFEFKPKSNTVNYYIYFLWYKNQHFNDHVFANMESDFDSYYSDAISILSGNTNNGSFTEIRQNNLNIEAPTIAEINKSNSEILISQPFVVTDPIHELNKIKPNDSGIPLFYNSLVFPFSKNIDVWDNDKLKFSNKPFLYNSFLLLDFYTSNDPNTQQKIMSIPVFVLNRYTMQEKNRSGISQIRPAFNLNEFSDGYSFFFLKKYIINRIFVKYSFWDALSGNKISLIPSSTNSKDKKGIQSTSEFIHKNEYLAFDMDYNTFTYKIFEYNIFNDDYDIEVYDLDLYELKYDDYWAGKLVPNKRPTKLQPDINLDGVFTLNKFAINNDTTLILSNISNDKLNSYLKVTNSDSPLKAFGKDFILSNFAFDSRGFINTLNFDEKIIINDLKSHGDTIHIDNLIFKNNGKDAYELQTILIKNLTIKQSTNTIYNNQQQVNTHYTTSWDQTPKTMINENFIFFDTKINNGDVLNFVMNLLRSDFDGNKKNLYFKYNTALISILNKISKTHINPLSDFFKKKYNGAFDKLSQVDKYGVIMKFSLTEEYKLFTEQILGFRPVNIESYFFENLTDFNVKSDILIRAIKENIGIDFMKALLKYSLNVNHTQSKNKLINLEKFDVLSVTKELNDPANSIRDYFIGVTCKVITPDTFWLYQNNQFDISVDLFVGEIGSYIYLNERHPMTISGDIEVIFSNAIHKERKFIIPLKHTINLK